MKNENNATVVSTGFRKDSEDKGASKNACKMCTPFGACLAFKGVRGSMTLLHGSQGCATYIRRYMISHFREPIDIASSNFTEDTAIFGGARNFSTALENVIRQYNPELIGIATTCLSETIGDDVKMMLSGFLKGNADRKLPALVNVSTPSYSGTHSEGYFATIRALVEKLAVDKPANNSVNIIPAMCSAADLRHLREIASCFTCKPVILPDYSDTLDGGSWDDYQAIPSGGTTTAEIASMGGAAGTIELYSCCKGESSAGKYLENRFGVPSHEVGLPMGMRRTDAFIDALSKITGKTIPAHLTAQRLRLVDSYVDAHKYLFGKRAFIYGDEDLVSGLAWFLGEIGVKVALAMSGGKSGLLEKQVKESGKLAEDATVITGADFEDMGEIARAHKPDIFIGTSKGYMLSRELNVPLVRVGMPVHDRFGGARIEHLGYRGTQVLFDRVVNALIEHNQNSGDWGYTYM